MNIRQNFIKLTLIICCMKYIIPVIQCYQKKLGIDENIKYRMDDADDAPVWKCLLKGGVKAVYARLVKNTDRPICLD